MAESIKTNAEESSGFMSDATLNKLLDYLRTVEQWTDSQIVNLLKYISK